ncbi:zinc-binding dehydrogenase [Bacillus mangrovi]|uniref:Zinc-binding dehydrogenase n=1 Tax=Metabacillus mangrovi TaxID=1491830 RepID=A0A7X2S2F3_9BACI|nr:quinone oxidoreductase [Metabacillus mangrovi]MTH51953.1 zinc-binding dehydrogenase [Metabacillus mangrovi]
MKALVFELFGGPEVLQYREIATPLCRPDGVLVKVESIGVNYADIYRRKGNYHLAGDPPYILGYEGAGVVAEAGSQVKDLRPGDRICFADVPYANAEYIFVPADHAIPLPDGISFDTAAAVMLQGLTAQYLTRDSFPVKEGDTAVVHAAAGGVGQILIQIIKLLGGRVIGLTSSDNKSAAALKAGADEVFLYEEDWVAAVQAATGGRGADAVFDSVGSTLAQSFSALRTGGTAVFYGMAGGDPLPVDPRMLMDQSKTLTGGDLWNVLTSKEERIKRSAELFQWILSGLIVIQPPAIFPLADGQEAHELLESRKSTGKILLKP